MASHLYEASKQGMKKPEKVTKDKNKYRDIICKRFCSYYKEGKEELSCGAFKLLKISITPGELTALIEGKFSAGILIEPEDLCQRCDFRFDDCDFYAGLSDRPCGGYNILKILKEGSAPQISEDI